MWWVVSSAFAGTLGFGPLERDTCGVVAGEIQVRRSLLARKVTVSALDHVVELRIPAGDRSAPFRVDAGREGPVLVRASWWFVEAESPWVSLPELRVEPAVVVPAVWWAGEADVVTLDATSSCPDARFRFEVTRGGAVVGEGVAPGTAPVTFPSQGPGHLQVRWFDQDREVARETFDVQVGPPCVDRDGDGHLACRDGDCDDTDPDVFLGHAEILGNRKDDDCDGVNGVDVDGDGFESAKVGGDDCDDKVAWKNPEGAWPDPDGDGATAAKPADFDCDGDVDRPTLVDCAEGDPSIPRPEDPDPTGVDEDCDGVVDEGTVAYDDDGDGLAELAGDCDDADASVRPGRRELPDCRDQDCDGEIDEGAPRPGKDDRYEPNDEDPAKVQGAAWVSGWLGGHWRGSKDHLHLVTRDGADVERFTVHAHDGPFDSFFVNVFVGGIGDDRSVEISVQGPGGSRTELVGRGESVGVGGSGGRDDTGDYDIVVRPHGGDLPFCPLELTVSTG